MNVPDRLDSVRVPDDLPKITAKADAKVPNAVTYTLMRECHTIGNLLRMCVPYAHHISPPHACSSVPRFTPPPPPPLPPAVPGSCCATPR